MQAFVEPISSFDLVPASASCPRAGHKLAQLLQHQNGCTAGGGLFVRGTHRLEPAQHAARCAAAPIQVFILQYTSSCSSCLRPSTLRTCF